MLKEAIRHAETDRLNRKLVIQRKHQEIDQEQAAVALLEDFLRNARALLAQAGEPDGAPLDGAAQQERPLDPESDPLWMGARAVLRRERRAMTVPELSDRMLSEGWKVLPTKIGIETLRATIVQKKDVFVRVQQGHYGLVEWPEDLRRVA